MIKDVKWNHDAGSKRTVFVHVTTEGGQQLTLEIEESLGQTVWIVQHRDFKVRLNKRIT